MQPYDAPTLLDGALKFWNHPALTARRTRRCSTFAQNALSDARNASWKKKQYSVMTQNALRQLIAVSPDFQTA